MKHSKKIIAIIMSIVLLVSAMPMLMASADTDYHYSGIWRYTVENGEAIIQGIETEQTLSGTISIPETLDDYPVTTIEWVSIWEAKVDLFIPASIAKIENPEWTAIGGGINNITVDETNPAFSSENGVLFNKDKTVLLRYPISNPATSYTVPSSVTTIGEYAFEGSNNLTNVVISDNVTTIEHGAFYECYNLKTATIGNNVTEIGNSAFIWCAGLESITIGNSVKTIGIDTFRGCESLESISIPASVTSIGKYALRNCYSLKNIEVAADNNNYSSDSNGVLFNKDKTELIQYPAGNERTSYAVPDSVIIIGEDAFAYCDSLTSITIPESITTIGNYAFYDCDGLTNVTISDSVTIIGDGAFYSCNKLSNISFGNNLSVIDKYAFFDCSDVTTVILPNGITAVGPESFCWSGIKEVYVPASIEELDCLAFEYTKLTDIYFEGSREQWNKINFKTDTENYDYSNGGEPFVLEYANIHFNYSIEPANGLCGENAIWNYNGMGILTISGTGAMAKYPQGENAPWNEFADKITTLDIKEGITEIDGFQNCTNIQQTILPQSLKIVNGFAYNSSITYKGMPEQWEEINFIGEHESDICPLCDSIIWIDNENFYTLDSLEIITDSTTVKYVETVYLYANIPNDCHHYFLPKGTRLCWYGEGNYFFGGISSGEEYVCVLTSENSGTTELTVRLENEDEGYTMSSPDGELLEASITLTSKAGIFEIIAYFFRSIFNMIFSMFMF